MHLIFTLLLVTSVLISTTNGLTHDFNEAIKRIFKMVNSHGEDTNDRNIWGSYSASSVQSRFEIPDGIPQDYPIFVVSQLIRRNAAFYGAQFADDPPFVESRFNDPDSEEWLLCSTTSTVEVPTTLQRASDGRFVTVAQDFSKGGFLQKISHVICKNTGEQCSFKDFPATHRSYCKQEHSQRKLFVYDPVSKNITSDVLLAPSCCTCRLKRINNS